MPGPSCRSGAQRGQLGSRPAVCRALLVRACDVAGARAAIRLAERVGGIIDHVDAEAALRELDVMRSFGKLI